MSKIISRHTKTEYKQGIVSLAEANDITAEGEQIIKDNSLIMIKYLQPKSGVIAVSPFGRTLATAKVINQIFREKGYAFDIDINPELVDLKFDYILGIKFVKGGVVESNGFVIDSKDTNPENITFEEYFHTDYIHNLPSSVLKKLPSETAKIIKEFETCPSACSRLEKEVAIYPSNTVFVTHECLTWNYLKRADRNPEEYLDRGQFFVLEEKDNYQTPIFFSQFRKK